MSDGGEGLLDALGGTAPRTTRHRPARRTGRGRVAHARTRTGRRRASDRRHRDVAGGRARALVPRPQRRRPGARRHDRRRPAPPGRPRRRGARASSIGCGGSATTDGGPGRVRRRRLAGRPLRRRRARRRLRRDDAASLDAAAVFGPQKGATPAQVDALSRRLVETRGPLPTRDRRRRHHRPGRRRRRGAGGRTGRAGRPHRARVRLRGRARRPGRPPAARPTSSSRARATSTRPPSTGKVPGGVLQLARAGRAPARPLPVLCIAGGVGRVAARRAARRAWRWSASTARFGRARAHGARRPR